MSQKWKLIPLKEVCDFVRGPFGGSLKKSCFTTEGYAVYEQQHAINDQFDSVRYFISEQKFQEMKRFALSPNDLIMSCSGTMGKVAIAPQNIRLGIINQALLKLTTADSIDNQFLKLWMQSPVFQVQLSKNTKGAAIKNVASVKVLKEIPINLPPLPEQKRIVAILDDAFSRIDAAIANTEKNITNARELFEGYLASFFSQQKNGWTKATISKLVEKEVLAKPLDGNHGSIHPKKADFVKKGIPFIMASDLVNGEVDQTSCNFISRKQADNLRKGFAKSGDILLSHKGTIGRSAVLTTSHDYVMLTPQVTYYRILNNNELSARFLYYFFQSPSFQSEMGGIAGIGSTRAYIGITKQLNLHISYPSIEEQERFTIACDNIVEATQQIERLYQQKLTALHELKQSILQKAFTGELTANMNFDKQVA